MDYSSTAQVMAFDKMVSCDFSVREDLLTLLPLKTTTKPLDISTAMKGYFKEIKCSLEKMFCVFYCTRDPDFPDFRLNVVSFISRQDVAKSQALIPFMNLVVIVRS